MSVRARDVDAGTGGGKGEIRGMKWIISAFAVMDSGAGAVNTPTSELRARYPGGFVLLSLELLWVRLSTFLTAGLAREAEASVDKLTENNVALIYADWIPFASSTMLDTLTLIRLPSPDTLLSLTLNATAPSYSALELSP